jgi:hypothetical protein
MGLRDSRFTLLCMAGAWVLVLAVLSACAEVDVVDATPAASAPEALASPLPGADQARDLAVLAVEFDPPLDYTQLIARRQAVALLVAVENIGASTEREVAVRAELTTEEDPAWRLVQDASVASIAPGEIQVVRFAPLGQIPYHHVYRLEVTVQPVEGETNLADNHKVFDIELRQEEEGP